MFDIIRFYQFIGREFVASGHKHSRPGWVQTPCPFCTGNPGYHLGFNLSESRFVCWRCGGKHFWITLNKITGIPFSQLDNFISPYWTGTPFVRRTDKTSKPSVLQLPPLQPLGQREMDYLTQRNFNPRRLQQKYKLQSTPPYGPYGYRIFIPIEFKKQLVTFQCRDWTERQPKKYLAARKDEELIPIKDVLYGYDQCTSNSVIVVEGVTGVWRFGDDCVATFGIQFTPAQVLLLSEFKTVYVLFDCEDQAQKQARRLSAELDVLGVRCLIVQPSGEYVDPGDMDSVEAESLKLQLLKKRI